MDNTPPKLKRLMRLRDRLAPQLDELVELLTCMYVRDCGNCDSCSDIFRLIENAATLCPFVTEAIVLAMAPSIHAEHLALESQAEDSTP